MDMQPIVAILYDFDKTLSPRDMQDYAFIPGIQMTPEAFWEKCLQTMNGNQMDQILAYMLVMIQEAQKKAFPLSREVFRKLGSCVELFEGVDTWFSRINGYAAKKGLAVEHYIISSGLKEIIEGTKIAGEFKRIYAAEYCYDESGEPIWPAMAVNYTSKTQFLFRINKGVLDVTQHRELNEFTPENKRRIPFRNMVYIGDGLTDVPCMRLVKENHGHSIAVYQGNEKELVNRMLSQGRVDFVAPARYTETGEMEKILFLVMDQIAATAKTTGLHMAQMDGAQALMEKGNPE